MSFKRHSTSLRGKLHKSGLAGFASTAVLHRLVEQSEAMLKLSSDCGCQRERQESVKLEV